MINYSRRFVDSTANNAKTDLGRGSNAYSANASEQPPQYPIPGAGGPPPGEQIMGCRFTLGSAPNTIFILNRWNGADTPDPDGCESAGCYGWRAGVSAASRCGPGIVEWMNEEMDVPYHVALFCIPFNVRAR